MAESEIIRSIIEIVLGSGKTDCISELKWLFSEYSSAQSLEEFKKSSEAAE